MKRTPEPELMNDPAQALAYAQADFSEPNTGFINQLLEIKSNINNLSILDIGCGPGDICFQLADQFPQAKLLGIDGADAMLDLANKAKRIEHKNVKFQQCLLPEPTLAEKTFDIILCNSLLHHLHNPEVLWDTIKQCGKTGSYIMVMDLFRPDSVETANTMTQTYVANEAKILQIDFYNSLLAAFTPLEVNQQLEKAKLTQLDIELTSDRHMLISGHI